MRKEPMRAVNMNVTSKMINKQLRTTGRIYSMMINFSSEANFRRNQRMMNRFFRGGKFKALQCSEEWIPFKKDDSKLRILIYKSLTTKENVAGVLWMHGGGYGIGLL